MQIHIKFYKANANKSSRSKPQRRVDVSVSRDVKGWCDSQGYKQVGSPGHETLSIPKLTVQTFHLGLLCPGFKGIIIRF